MSAFIFYRRQDDIHLFTDTAAYDRQGTIHWFESKVKRLPAGIGVLWSRGNLDLSNTLWRYVDNFAYDFDTLVNDLESVANQLVHWGVGGDIGSEIGLAGWSKKRKQLESYFWCSKEPFGEFAPLRLHVLNRNAGSPIPDPAYLAATGWPDDPGEAGDFVAADPRAAGLQLMEAMRRCKMLEGAWVEPGGYCVGGAVELTTIDRDGVSIETLHTWPGDRVGSKIHPEPILVAVRDVTAGMNRRQRRAAAAERRESAACA